jgi:hypothetical protein
MHQELPSWTMLDHEAGRAGRDPISKVRCCSGRLGGPAAVDLLDVNCGFRAMRSFSRTARIEGCQ